MAFQLEPSDSGSAASGGSSLSEINVIPFVDVALVLLLIFMLTAPMMYRGIDVSLPKAGKDAKSAEMEDRMILTLTKEKGIYLNDKPVLPGRLDQELAILFKNRKDKTLYVKADRSLVYGFVVETMDSIRTAGVKKIGMITEPAERNGLKRKSTLPAGKEE